MALVSNVFIAQYYGTYEINNEKFILWFSNVFDIHDNKSDVKNKMFIELDSYLGKRWLIAIYNEDNQNWFDKENNSYIDIYNYVDWYKIEDYIKNLNPIWFSYINIKII